jgi:hypothetical protein
MTFAEVLVKTYRLLTLLAALLITLGEGLVFNSQSARAPERQANAGTASTYWAAAASDARSPQRVR